MRTVHQNKNTGIIQYVLDYGICFSATTATHSWDPKTTLLNSFSPVPVDSMGVFEQLPTLAPIESVGAESH